MEERVCIVFASAEIVSENAARSASTAVMGMRFDQKDEVVWVVGVDHWQRRGIFGCTEEDARRELGMSNKLQQSIERPPTEMEKKYVEVGRRYNAVRAAGGSVYLAKDASCEKTNLSSAICVAKISARFGRGIDIVRPVSPQEDGNLIGVYRHDTEYAKYPRVNGEEFLQFCIEEGLGQMNWDLFAKKIRERYPKTF